MLDVVKIWTDENIAEFSQNLLDASSSNIYDASCVNEIKYWILWHVMKFILCAQKLVVKPIFDPNDRSLHENFVSTCAVCEGNILHGVCPPISDFFYFLHSDQAYELGHSVPVEIYNLCC